MDRDVIRRLADGDLDAVRQCLLPVKYYLMGQAGHYLPAADIDALAVESVGEAALGAHQYEGRGRPETWLIAIAKNRLRSELRSRRRWHYPPYAPRIQQVPPAPDDGREVEQRATERIHNSQIAELAWQEWTPEQREAVKLVLLEELSYKEAGARMDKSPSAVGSLILRAMKTARRVIAELNG